MDTTPRRPGSVTLASWLFFVLLLVGVLTLVVGVAQEQSRRGPDPVGASPLWSLAPSLVVPLVQVFVVSRMRAGRNWARIVLLVLVLLAVVVTGPVLAGAVVAGATGGLGTATLLVGASLVVDVVAAVAMLTPAANRYFRGHR